ncbi:M28 family metallopeptidase [Paenibacillaceae bacterium WGS1546]|uniref:M28 family metallopeptidase n=1 Tax=Cohnella sp. WGS1546 TaxID=3366810 RepID=UPI00372D78A7
MKTKIVIVLSLLLFTACDQQPAKEVIISGGDYSSIVRDLTSDSMDGRLPGTEGNSRAEAYIAKHFESIGIEPYKNSFAMPYEHKDVVPDENSLALTVEYASGSKEILKYGIDYLDQRIPYEYEGSGTYTFDLEDSAISNQIVIVDSADDLRKLQNKSVKMIFVKQQSFKKYLRAQSNPIPVIQVSEEKYHFFKEKQNDIKQITFKSSVTEKKIEASNIAGIIRGEGGHDHRDAIILSAHFDSLGSIGDLHYRGAVDNATGVTALIQLAYNIKEHSNTKSLHPDIIFVAFNGEESGRQGSKAFVEEIRTSGGYSQIFNINLDCIGVKDGGSYLIIGDETSNVLSSAMNQFFMHNHFPIKQITEEYESDHLSFLEKKIPAVTIGQEQVHMIHTTEDTIDDIDFDSLQQIVTAIFNFVISINHLEVPESDSEQQPNIEMDEQQLKEFLEAQKANVEAQKMMKIGQYQLLGSLESSQIVIKNNETFSNLVDAMNIFDGLYIPQNILEYSFENVKLNTNFQVNDIEIEGLKYNQLYEFDDISIKDILNMNVLYLKNETDAIEITISRNALKYETDHEDHEENRATLSEDKLMYNDIEYSIYSTGNHIFIGREISAKESHIYVRVVKGEFRVEETSQGTVGSVIFNWPDEDRSSAIKFVHDLRLEELIKKMGF